MFICNHCPFVQAIASKLTRDTKDLAAIGVGSVAIMSNDTVTYPEDSFDNMVLFKEKVTAFRFPTSWRHAGGGRSPSCGLHA